MLLFSIFLDIMSVKFVNSLEYHHIIMLKDAISITVLIISVSSGHYIMTGLTQQSTPSRSYDLKWADPIGYCMK